MPQAELNVIITDAGQGDCALVVYPDNSVMMIDCGSTKDKAIVQPEVEAALRRNLNGGTTIETLVLTHPDQDHYNMLADVSTTLNLRFNHVRYGGQLTEYNRKLRQALTARAQDVRGLGPGYNDKADNALLTRSGVAGRILAANVMMSSVRRKASGSLSNQNSVVIVLKYGGIKFFLMGDATEETESFIVQKHKQALAGWKQEGKVVLKVGHHGSNTSTKKPFIDAIKPEVAFISSGTRRFGCAGGVGLPRGTVIDDLRSWTTLHTATAHNYVEFDDRPKNAALRRYHQVKSSDALYTTVYAYRAKPAPAPDEIEGGSYYYTVASNGAVTIHTTES